MLAHEVKNPLSGIRGAAQLLEHGASENDRELCQLIQDEVDRIRGLVDRMDMFSDRKSTRLNSSHANISYAVFCLKKKNQSTTRRSSHTPRLPRHSVGITRLTRSVWSSSCILGRYQNHTP